MNDHPFLTIIVPAYNVERYLPQTLDSIINQSFEDYEVIIINDGSCDHTLSVIKDYAKDCQRIKYVNKSNEGVAIARNAGLDEACGDYVLFVDGDDTLLDDTLKKIHEKLSGTDIDLLRYEHQTVDDTGNSLYPNYNIRRRRPYRDTVITNINYIKNILMGECFLWVHVFRRSLIEKHYIRFLPHCTYNEDTLFLIQYLQHCHHCLYIDSVLYSYRKYSGAVTAKFTSKNFDDVLEVFERIKGISCDDTMKRALRPLLERLGLHLLKASSHLCKEDAILPVAKWCSSNPVTPEWKIIRCLGVRHGHKILTIVELMYKAKRILISK